jgi:hypothetical protein
MNKKTMDIPTEVLSFFGAVLVLFLWFSPTWAGLNFPWQGPVSPVNELDVNHRSPRVAVDGQGNAYAIWEDYRRGHADIYFSYKPLGGAWNANTVVNDDTGGFKQISPCIAVDSSGNAFALWVDYRNGNPDIYFAHRPAGGNWGANVRVNDDGGTAFQSSPAVVVDGNGTAYAVWEDGRNGPSDIYFSFLPTGSGWQANVKVNDDAGSASQKSPAMALDGSRNAYLVWRDSRNGSDQIFFAYRPSGGSWQTNVRVDDDAGVTYKYQPVLAVDPAGNACAAWQDYRNGWPSDPDIYAAYRPANTGTWAANMRVNDDPPNGYQDAPTITVTNLLGINTFWVDWSDARNGNLDVYGSVFAFIGWTPNSKQPTTADTASQYNPSLGEGLNRHACLLWEDSRDRQSAIYGSCRPPDGVWEENRRVNDDVSGDSFQYDPAVFLDSQGRCVLVWEDNRNGTYNIYSSIRPPGGPWGPSTKVNDDPGFAGQDIPALAGDADGNVLAVWEDSRNDSGDIFFSFLPPGGNWGANVRVNDDTGTGSQRDPAIAVDSQGNAYAIWADYRSGKDFDIFFSFRPRGGAWGLNVRVNDNGLPAYCQYPSIGVDGQGNAYAVWRDSRNGGDDIFFSFRPAGGNWGANIRVNEELAASRYDPVIAVDGQGNAHAVWEETSYPDRYIHSSYRPFGGNWGPGVKVVQGEASGNASDPFVVVDGSGRAIAIWAEVGTGYRWDIMTATRTGGEAWETLTRINRDSGQSYKYLPALALNPSGQMVAAWEDYAYGNRAIFYAVSGSQIHLPLVLR